MEPIRPFESTLVVVPVDNIDTDQVIPARFLKVTDRTGLGEALFADWRYDADGNARDDFVLNKPEYRGAEVLVAGDNFGCGSSREHASWALLGYGFKAVISTSFGDIFRNNALKNGFLPIVVDAEMHARLVELGQSEPEARVRVDLERQVVVLPDGSEASFPVEPFAKYCLLNGVDQLGYLVSAESDIAAFEEKRGDLAPAGGVSS